MDNKRSGLCEIKHERQIQKWMPVINTCMNSGLSKQEWCKQNGINIKTYYYWQKKIFDMSVDAVEFAELIPAEKTENRNTVASISVKGVSVNLFSGIDSKTVSAIVKGLSDV